jgi:hypothetical protein
MHCVRLQPWQYQPIRIVAFASAVAFAATLLLSIRIAFSGASSPPHSGRTRPREDSCSAMCCRSKMDYGATHRRQQKNLTRMKVVRVGDASRVILALSKKQHQRQQLKSATQTKKQERSGLSTGATHAHLRGQFRHDGPGLFIQCRIHLVWGAVRLGWFQVLNAVSPLG